MTGDGSVSYSVCSFPAYRLTTGSSHVRTMSYDSAEAFEAAAVSVAFDAVPGTSTGQKGDDLWPVTVRMS